MDQTAAPAAPASSRFNMDTLEEKKKPAFQRGKDGHLTLNAADDFFSNPLGGSAGRANSLGGCQYRPGVDDRWHSRCRRPAPGKTARDVAG